MFEPSGVVPVHTDLKDGGVSFGALLPFSCVIHDCCFSPANLNIMMDDTQAVAVFVSVAFHPSRGDAVVTQHVLPTTDAAEAAMVEMLDASPCARVAVEGMRAAGFSAPADAIARWF